MLCCAARSILASTGEQQATKSLVVSLGRDKDRGGRDEAARVASVPMPAKRVASSGMLGLPPPPPPPTEITLLQPDCWYDCQPFLFGDLLSQHAAALDKPLIARFTALPRYLTRLLSAENTPGGIVNCSAPPEPPRATQDGEEMKSPVPAASMVVPEMRSRTSSYQSIDTDSSKVELALDVLGDFKDTACSAAWGGGQQKMELDCLSKDSDMETKCSGELPLWGEIKFPASTLDYRHTPSGPCTKGQGSDADEDEDEGDKEESPVLFETTHLLELLSSAKADTLDKETLLNLMHSYDNDEAKKAFVSEV